MKRRRVLSKVEKRNFNSTNNNQNKSEHKYRDDHYEVDPTNSRNRNFIPIYIYCSIDPNKTFLDYRKRSIDILKASNKKQLPNKYNPNKDEDIILIQPDNQAKNSIIKAINDEANYLDVKKATYKDDTEDEDSEVGNDELNNIFSLDDKNLEKEEKISNHNNKPIKSQTGYHISFTRSQLFIPEYMSVEIINLLKVQIMKFVEEIKMKQQRQWKMVEFAPSLEWYINEQRNKVFAAIPVLNEGENGKIKEETNVLNNLLMIVNKIISEKLLQKEFFNNPKFHVSIASWPLKCTNKESEDERVFLSKKRKQDGPTEQDEEGYGLICDLGPDSGSQEKKASGLLNSIILAIGTHVETIRF